VFVLFYSFSIRLLLTINYTANPFASTHSLDTNPFDDPIQSPSHAAEAARLEQLQQRERDIEQREQELNAKADHIRRHGRNNWPPCPSFLLIYFSSLNPFLVLPLIFHSIQDEIPEASRPLITRLYQLWLVLFLTLIINMVACIFILTAGAADGGRDVGASIG
jgi:secretory carrier-associated membrane protein